MDIGAVIKGPFEDQDWAKKLILMGVVNILVCITVIGIFVGIPNLVGWGKAYAQERARGGSTLPDFGFGYIGDGYKVIIGMFIFGVIAMIGMIPIFILGALLRQVVGDMGALIILPLNLAYALILLPVAGIIMARIQLDDDMMAGTGIVAAIMTVKDNVGPSVMYVVASLAIGLVATVIGFVPFIGAMFAVPFQLAAGGIALVQFRAALGSR